MPLLTKIALDDYYLGKLVFKAIINTVNDKLMNDYPLFQINLLMGGSTVDNDDENKYSEQMNDIMDHDVCVLQSLKEDEDEENEEEELEIMMKRISNNNVCVLQFLKEYEDKENKEEDLEIIMKRNSNNLTSGDNNNNDGGSSSSRGSNNNKKERIRRRRNMMYGLTIRIEEKRCLRRLRKMCIEMSASLDDDYDDNDEYDYNKKEYSENCNDDRLMLDANRTGLELGSSGLNHHQQNDDSKRSRLF